MKARILFVSSVLVASLLGGTATLLAADKAAAPKTPRSVDGHPDLTGTWDNGGGIPPIVATKEADGSICIRCKSGGRPEQESTAPVYKPEFRAKVADLGKNQVRTDSSLHCRNPGLPRIGPPDKIVQTKGQLVFLYDDLTGMAWRIIPTDGRPHNPNSTESYLGDSVGRWEGDTMVIEAVNITTDSWLGENGLFHTDKLKVIERLRRVGDVLEYQATADDPAVLEKPWTMALRKLPLADFELEETPPCFDKDFALMIDDTYHPNRR